MSKNHGILHFPLEADPQDVLEHCSTDIVLLGGLPGSGKSYWLSRLDTQANWKVFDDYFYNLPYLDDFTSGQGYRDILDCLDSSGHCLVVDVRFCDPRWRYGARLILEHERPEVSMGCILFENQVDRCKQNILRRNRPGRVEDELEILKEYSRYYRMPKQTIVLPVF